MSTILSPPRRTIAPALWDAPVVVRRCDALPRFGLMFAAALDLDACEGDMIHHYLDGGAGTVLARCLADRPGVWQTTDAATVPL